MSPDGTKITYIKSDGLYIADADGGNERQIYTANDVHTPKWSKDSLKIVFERGSIYFRPVTIHEIWVYELGSVEAHKIADGVDPAWAPDSKRLVYVTVLDEDATSPLRNQLRMSNWRGENTWTAVSDLPDGTPPIGILDLEAEPSELDHIIDDPFWDTTGTYIYVSSFVLYQALADFRIWERIDAKNGGSVFQGELKHYGGNGILSPNGQAVLFAMSGVRGEAWFTARGLGTPDEQWQWAETPAWSEITHTPTWSPESDAIAYVQCARTQTSGCSLRILTPQGESVVINGLAANSAVLDWKADE